jgi:hypothetical protein
MMPLFLILGMGLIAAAVLKTGRLQNLLARQPRQAHILHKSISMLVVVTEFGHIVETYAHTSIATVAATLIVVTIVLAQHSGAESELY